MNTNRLFFRPLIYCVLAAVVIAVAPSICLGNGAGPEPGQFCDDSGISKYFPPPFIGNVTLQLVIKGTGEDETPYYAVDIKAATLYQVGNTACKLVIEAIEDFWINPVNESKFADSKPSDFRQICLQRLLFDFYNCDSVYDLVEYVEVIGVGHLVYDEGSKSSTAQFVVMPIE